MDEPTPSPPSSARIRGLLPVALGYVAGYVDGCTFVALFGLFVAQVTGSFVAVGASLARRAPLGAPDAVGDPGLRSRRSRRERYFDDFAPSATARFPNSARPGECSAGRDVGDGVACGRDAKSRSAGRIVGRYVRSVGDGRTERVRGPARERRAVDECDDHQYRESRDRRGACADGRVAREVDFRFGRRGTGAQSAGQYGAGRAGLFGGHGLRDARMSRMGLRLSRAAPGPTLDLRRAGGAPQIRQRLEPAASIRGRPLRASGHRARAIARPTPACPSPRSRP